MTTNDKASFKAVGCRISRITMGADSATVEIENDEGKSIKLTVLPLHLNEKENDVLTVSRVRELVACSFVCQAYKKGLDLLGYCDNSKTKLVKKLTQRGFSKTSATDAVALLEQKGFIREDEHCFRTALEDAKKLYGPKRISERLYSLGFEKKHILKAVQKLEDETDFIENLKTYIIKKNLCSDLTSTDRAVKQKAVSCIYRRGFTSQQLRKALEDME